MDPESNHIDGLIQGSLALVPLQKMQEGRARAHECAAQATWAEAES
jgi:hypothetical protein